MQYNKRQFNKVNDKKVMKKVKKQWIVVSLATLAFLGGSAYMMSSTRVAHADDKQSQPASNSSNNSSNNQNDGSVSAQYANQTPANANVSGNTYGNQSLSADAQKAFNDGLGVKTTVTTPTNNNDNQNNNNSNSTATTSTVSTNTTTTTTTENSSSKSSNNDTLQNNTSQEDKGNNNSNNQNDNSATSTTTSSNSDVQQATSDANKYKDVINEGAADAFAGKNNNVSTVNEDAQNYYNAAYNGAANARYKYYNLTTDQGTSDKDYTSYNQNVNSNQKASDAYSSATTYEKGLITKFNGKNNTTVKLNEQGQITIPTQDDAYITNNNTYTTNSELYLTYQYGVNYYLAHQGVEDAKSGKWSGISSKQGLVYDANRGLSFPGDNYHPSQDSTNAYDQAYLGAQQAMNDQWDPVYDTINGGVNTDGTNWGYVLGQEKNSTNFINGTSYYRTGYDSVAQEINNDHTAFVHNSWQFQRALAGNYDTPWKLSDIVNGTNGANGYSAYNDAWGKTVNASNVRLVNDIDFLGAPYTEYWPTMYHLKKLVVDAQNHQADFHGCLDQFYADAGVNPVLIIKNFQVAYSYNFYGFLKINQPGTVIYDNVNYVGAQMLSDFPAGGNDIRFKGNINNLNLANYQTSLNDGIHPTEGSGNQENMEIQNLLMYPGTHFFGSVAPDYGNNVIKLSGSLTMNDGSQMTLIPRGNGGYYARNGSNYGIVVTNGANLNINKGAILQIVPDKWNGSNTFANGIYTYGNVNVNGGTLDIETNAPSYFNNAAMYVDQTGQVNIANGGLVKVQSQNLSNTSTNGYGILYNNQGKINVNNLGNLNVNADGTGQINLVSGPISITNPGQNNITLDLTKNSNNQSTISNNQIDAYTSLVTYGNRSGSDQLSTTKYPSQILYSFHLNNKNQNNYVDASANAGSFPSGTPNYLQIATVPAVYFVGPMTPVKNEDGTYTLTGYAQVGGHKPEDKDPIYIQAGYGTNNSYTGLNYLPGNIHNTVTKDHNVYSQTIDIPSDYNYQIIKYAVNMPKDYNPKVNPYVGLLLRYGVDGIDTTAQVQTGDYVSSQHRYDLDKNNNLVDVGQQVITSGNYNKIGDGVGNALTDVSNNNTNSQDINQYKINANYTSGYNSVVAGYNAFNNGQPDPTNNPAAIPSTTAATASDQGNNAVVNDPSAYIQGYNRAKADAEGTKKGINDMINGNPQVTSSTATVQYNNNYNNAYYNVLRGYTDKGNNVVSPLSNSVSYQQGFYARKNFTDGQNDAYQGKVDTNRIQNDAAYHVGVSAFNDAKSQVLTGSHIPSGQGQIYTDAYNQALQNLTNNYNDGSNAFLNNGVNDTEETSTVATQVASQGYSDAQDGYNGVNKGNQNLPGYQLGQSIKSGVTAVLNGNVDDDSQAANKAGYDKGYQDALSAFTNGVNSGNTTVSGNVTQAYQDGLTAAKNANDAIAKAENDLEKGNTSLLNNTDTTDSVVYKTAYNAYKQAFNDIRDGKNSTSANQSSIYQAVYNNASTQIKKQYDKGISDFLDNKQDSNNKAYGYTQAYSDAQKAYNDFNDKFSKNDKKVDGISITIDNPSSAYKQVFNALLDSKRGAADAQEQLKDGYNRPADSTNSDYMKGFNAVRDAYADAAKLNPSTSQTSRAYVDAYNEARDEVSQEYKKADGEFLSGKDKPSDNSPLATQAFQDTSYGYQTGLSVSDESQLSAQQRNNRGFMDGFHAAQSIAKGYQTAEEAGLNHKYESKDYEEAHKNITSIDADYSEYQAYLGAKAGLNGVNIDGSNHSLAYKQAYQKAYAQSQSDAEQGVKDYLRYGLDKRGINKIKNSSQYDSGYENAKTGFELFEQYYKNNGYDPRKLNEISLISQDHPFSYKEGFEAARSAYSYLNGNSLNELNPDSSQAIAYNQAQQGYTDAMNNPDATKIADNDNTVSESYKIGYNNVVDQVINGYNDAIKDQRRVSAENNVMPSDTNYDKAQSYLGAVAGINAAQDSTQSSTADASYPVAYQKSYAKAYQLWKDNLSNGANLFVNGQYNSNNQYNGQGSLYANQEAGKTSLNMGYIQAQNGFNDALYGKGKSEPTNSTFSGAYDTGYQSYNDSLNGINAAKNEHATSAITVGNPTPDKAYVDGYNAYVQAKSDVPTGLDAATNKSEFAKQDAMYQSLYPIVRQQLVTSYQNGQQSYLNGYDENAAHNSDDELFNQGFSDAKSGVQTGLANTTDNQLSQHGAYKAGKTFYNSYIQGYKNAQSSTSNNSTDQIGVDAFNGSQDAYNASISNAPYQLNPNKSLAYNIAYQNAYADGQHLHEKGANEFLNGQGVNPATNVTKGFPAQAEQDGYNQAQNGYQMGMSSNPLTDVQKNNPSFMLGYNAAIIASAYLNGNTQNQAVEKTVKTKNQYADYNNNFEKYFQDADKGYSDGSTTQLTNTAAKYSPAYLTGYYAARGMVDFTNNQPLTTQSNLLNNLTDSTSAQTAYNTGYNQAVKGFNEAADGLTKLDSTATKAENSGFNSFNNSSAKTDITNGINQAKIDFYNSPSLNSNVTIPAAINNKGQQVIAAYQNSYVKAKNDYANGVNEYLNGVDINATKTINDNPSQNQYDFYNRGFMDARNAYAQTLLGVKDSANDSSQSGSSIVNTPISNTINQTLKVSKPNTTVTLPATNNDGNALGNAEATGLINAFKDLKATGSLIPQSKSDVNYQNAATAMLQAQNDLLTHTSMDLTNKGLLYSNAYALAKQYAQDEYQNGEDSVLKSIPLDNDAFAIQAASNTQNGFVDALNGLEPNGVNQKNVQYMAGHDAGILVKNAYVDTMSNPNQNKNYSLNDGTNDADSNNVEAAVKLALSDFESNKTRTSTDSAFANRYTGAAYNAATSAIQTAALNGMSNYLFNQSRLDKIFTTAEQQGFDKGSKDAQDGFTFGLTTSTMPNGESQYYQNGFNEAQHVLQAIKDGTADGPQGINSPKIIETAYQEAYQATLDAQNSIKNGGTNDQPSDADKHDNVYNQAYKLAFDQNQKTYLEGAISFVQGKASPNKLDMNTSGYNKAQDGYDWAKQQTFAAGSSNSDKISQLQNDFAQLPDVLQTNAAYKTGYQAYLGELKGYQAALENADNKDERNKMNASDLTDSASYAETIREGSAYNGAVDALNDYLQHDVANSPKHADNSVYENAYQRAASEVASHVNAGAEDFLAHTNTQDPNASEAGLLSKASSKGFTDAMSGFNTVQNLSDSDLAKQTKAYKQGYQAKQQALIGLATSMSDTKPADATAAVAYDAARDARKALSINQVNTNFADKDAVYKYVYNQVVSDYQAGMDKFKADDKSANTGDMTTGHTDENNGYAAGLTATGNTDLSNHSKGYVDGFNLGKASADAYHIFQNSKQDGNNNHAYNGDSLGTSAFDGAQDGYKDAFDSNKKYTTARKNENSIKAYKDAYDKAYASAVSAIQNGMNAFHNYAKNDDDAKPSANLAADQSAIDKGYTDAKSGYNDAYNYVVKNPTASDVNAGRSQSDITTSYNDGYQLGLDVAQSLAAARNDITADKLANNNADSDANVAFNGAKQGFVDGKNTINSHSVDTTKPGAYQKAYVIALNEAQQQYTNGNQEFLAGKTNPSGTATSKNADVDAYNTGYQETSDGYNDGMKGVSNPISQASGYKAGYNRGISLARSFADAQNGNADYTGTDQTTGAFSAKETFDAAKAGFQRAASFQTAENNSDKSISYQNAYNLAYQEYNDALMQGFDDFSNGKADNPTKSTNYVDKAIVRGYQIASDAFADSYNGQASKAPTDTSKTIYDNGYDLGTGARGYVFDGSYDAHNAAQAKGYADAKAGFEAAANGAQNPQSNEPSYAKGFQAYNNYVKGVHDGSIKNGQQLETTQDYGDAYQATQAARNDFMHYQNTDNSQHTPIYQSIFNIKGKEFLNQYEAGKNAYLTGTNNKGTDFHAQGYQDAIDGFAAGFASDEATQTQNTDNIGYTESYQAGQSAWKGYQAALANKNHNDSGDDSIYATDAFNAAVQALNDAYNLNNTGLGNDKSIAAQNGYKTMLSLAQKAVEDGLTSFTNTATLPTNTGNSLDKLKYDAYITTYDGYQAGLSGNFDNSQSNNKAYVHGYDLGKGANEFLNTKPQADSSLDNSVVSQGYKDAEAGYNAAKSNASLTAAQKADKVFMAGYNARVNAVKGAAATYNESNVDTDRYADYGHDAVIQAVNDVRNGVKTDISGQPQAYQDQYNDYFNKAYGNYDEIKSNVTNSKSTDDISKQSNVTGDYFNAIKQYLNKNDATLPNNLATKRGIADAKQAYTNGIASVDKTLPYAGYLPAYNVGLKLSIGFLAAKNDVTSTTVNTGNVDANTKADIMASHDGAIAGYQAAKQGGPAEDTNANDSLPYSASYEVAYNMAMNKIKEGNNNFLTSAGAGQPSDSNAMEAASYNFGYNETRDGYKDAINNQPQKSGASSSYVSGYQAAINAQQGRDDANHDKNYQSNDVQYMAGYNATKAARHDARLTNNQPSDVASQPWVYQDVYQNEYFKDNTAYINGVNNYTKNVDNDSDASEFQKLGYADTQAGYADTLREIAGNNDSYGYQQGIQLAKDNVLAYQTAFKDPKQLSTKHFGGSNIDATQTYNAAIAAYQQILGEHAKNVDANASIAYQRAYNTAYDDAKAALLAGSQRFMDGLSNDKAQGANADDVAYTMGYNNTQNGYADGYKAIAVDKLTTSQQGSATFMTGYNLGKGALDFVNGLTEGKATATNTDMPIDAQANYHNGYAMAQKGYQLAASGVGHDKLTNAQLNNPAFMSGYNMQDEIQQGIHDAMINSTQSGKFNSNSPHDRAYRAVIDALNDFQQGHKRNMDNQPIAYASAYNDIYAQIKNQAAAGSKQYLSGKENDHAQSQNILDRAYTMGYHQAQAGAQNVYDQVAVGKSVTDNQLTDVQRKDASFMTGFRYAEGAVSFVNGQNPILSDTNAQDGYNDASAGYDLGMSGISIDKLSVDQRNDKAFMIGFNKSGGALSGYRLAQQEFGTSDNKHMSNNDQDVAYRGAIAGFLAAKAGKAMQPTDESLVYVRAYQKAYQEWQSLTQQGVSDALAGTENRSSGFNVVDKASYNNGYQATSVALHDAQSKSINVGTVTGSFGLNNSIYSVVFNGYVAGYQAGYHLESDQATNSDSNYRSAFAKGYALGNKYAPKPVLPTVPEDDDRVVKDFTMGSKAKQFDSVDARNAYNANYVNVTNGFYASIKPTSTNSQSDNYYFKQGYQLAQEVKRAIRDAKSHPKWKHSHIKHESTGYIQGFDAYRAGILSELRNIRSAKYRKHRVTMSTARKLGTLYDYAFRQGYKAEKKRQVNNGTRAGKYRGTHSYHYAASISKHTVDYVRSYQRAYKKVLSRRLPRYIYNIKAVYTHRRTHFTRDNRIVYYAKKPRYAAHVFRIRGIAFYKNGVPRYRVAGGILTASPRAIRSAYYSYKNKATHYRVIRPTGVWIHEGSHFSVHNRIRRIKRGQIIKIRRVVKYKGLTRLYFNDHQYITSNKTYVKMTRK